MSLHESEKLSKVVVAITGASGIVYGLRLVKILSNNGLLDGVIYTRSAVAVAKHEEGIDLENLLKKFTRRVYSEDRWDAPYASSSNTPGALVIAPCSMNTLAKIANGIQDNLVTRAANSVLRLKRRLVLVIRETPLGIAEIENMLKAAIRGAVILPASPGFYTKPKSIDDLINFIVGKVLDVLNLEHNLYKRWGE
ncbi:flavin prenyltransferase UbiX [Pyrofollis japonicus]|uniref:UbiX family flavin prenyltransferase n=1 Tax=Pyrofollis japonicus TaxID=3060460 RepID=UPI00295BEDA8|nr:UbiX family flavin prenyltransferase [Pyrofollis japonicus]BEP18186.1 flavin prenyltransferase UbiX [Pyrofollis japonicus]